MKKRAALIVDNSDIAMWQLAALSAAKKNIDVVMLLNCRNTRLKKKYFKNFLYYILNFFSLKNRLTKKTRIDNCSCLTIDFQSGYDGAWQLLPSDIYKAVEREEVDLIIKFGMGLLRVDDDRLRVPILSFHHGDPSKYRGRPAGFYEILNGEKTSGIIVQRLSNRLDAGKVLAFAESKIVNYSYKKTALNFYGNSEFLLNKAITNLDDNKYIEKKVDGINYRLPSNLQVLKLVGLMIFNIKRKILYGLFFEKRWRVAVADARLGLRGDNLIAQTDLSPLPICGDYNFHADPFFSVDGSKIRLEALDNKTSLGDILEIDIENFSNQRVLKTGNHFSYPFSFKYNDVEYLLPEVASHSAPYFCEPNEREGNFHFLKGLQGKRIVDATMIFWRDYYYLFFGEDSSAHTQLSLWYSSSPFDDFKPHPMNPIVIDPGSARMGGGILVTSGMMFRFGQNNAGEYGESLAVNEIVKLSVQDYEERQVGTIRMERRKGPHCISFSDDRNRILIDYYSNQFSLFAGIRRIKAKLKKS